MSDHYDGAGDGQCLGIKGDGERCTNGVYGTNYCCGTHKNASDVTLAPEQDDREWFHCDRCGWQRADYEVGGGAPPFCSECGVEFGGPLRQWGRDDGHAVTDGGADQSDAELEKLAEREKASRCELCRGSPLSADLRPTCVEGREAIPLMCAGCYFALRDAGRLDLERDAEVFGYADFA